MPTEPQNESANREKLLCWLSYWVVFFLPIKLSLSYFGLAALLLVWLICPPRRAYELLSNKLLAPLWWFFAIAFMFCFFGVDTGRSLKILGSFFFSALAIPALAESFKSTGTSKPLTVLILAQTLTAVHTVLHGAVTILPDKFLPGAVTESGQLALLIPVVLSLGLRGERRDWYHRISSGILFVAACIVGFWGMIGPLPLAAGYLAIGAFLVALLFSVWCVLSPGRRKPTLLFYTTILPLLSAALIVNLKRGPWAGVFVAMFLFIASNHPKKLWGVFLSVCILAATVTPIRDRIAHSYDHFEIYGGRAEIWSIGKELAGRYPLGIGIGNSRFLQNYSSSIPKELNHFHNVYLNLLVETGAVGLVLYCLWLYGLIRSAWGKSYLEQGLTLAIISTMVAGIVEYNLGDSEVKMVFFVLVAVLLALRSKVPALRTASV